MFGVKWGLKIGTPLQQINVREAYQFSFPSNTEHVCEHIRNAIFYHKRSICVPGKKLHFRRVRAHIPYRIGMKLVTPLQNIMLEKVYQVSFPSHTERVHGRVQNAIFYIGTIHSRAYGKKYAFRTRPRTCSVSDRDETWYTSPTHHVEED